MKSTKKNKRKDEQRNVHVISFRVNAEERDELLKQAKKCGGNLSLLIRKKLDIPVQNAGMTVTACQEEWTL